MIGLTLQPQEQLGHPAGNIRITNCYATRPGGQDQVFFYLRQGDGTITPGAAAIPLGLAIGNCRSDGVPGSMTVMSVKGMQVFNCVFNQAASPQMQHSVDCRFANVLVNGSLFQPA